MKLSIQDTINSMKSTVPQLPSDIIAELQTINPASQLALAPTASGVYSNGLRVSSDGTATNFDK